MARIRGFFSDFGKKLLKYVALTVAAGILVSCCWFYVFVIRMHGTFSEKIYLFSPKQHSAQVSAEGTENYVAGRFGWILYTECTNDEQYQPNFDDTSEVYRTRVPVTKQEDVKKTQ